MTNYALLVLSCWFKVVATTKSCSHSLKEVEMLVCEEASIEVRIGLNQRFGYFLERNFLYIVGRNCRMLVTTNFSWWLMILEMKHCDKF